MLRWIALLLVSSLSAQVAPAPKYRVVKTEKVERKPSIAAVNALADQGYRLLVPGPLFILRLESTPPDIYRYMAMKLTYVHAATSDENNPVKFLDWVNEQGAHGYRWVPGAGVMEKEPHPKNYEYVNAVRYATLFPSQYSGLPKTSLLSSLIGEGYRPVESVFFPGRISSGHAEIFFERELGAKPEPMHMGQRGEIKIADAMRAGNVLKQVDVLAKIGYRYLGPYVSQLGGGLAVMMQKCGQECEAPFEYRYFDVHDMGQLVKELNERGKDGFRVVSKGLRSRPHVLERGGAKKETYAYHVLQTKDPVALEQTLNAPENEGYEPIGYVGRSGFWTGEVFLLLEKATTASASPERLVPEPLPSK